MASKDVRDVYPVLFTKTKKAYLVEVPDLDVVTEGKNFNDAIKMARDVIGLTGVTLQDNNKKIPKPSKSLNVKKGIFFKEGETIISYVDINFSEYRKSIDNKIVRRNITLPRWLDRKVKELNINVSRFVTESLSKKVACL